MINSFELLGREKKARKLADVIHATGITASMTAAADEEQSRNFWAIATEGAEVHPPSEETRKLVLSILTEREQLEANHANSVRPRELHGEATRGHDSL